MEGQIDAWQPAAIAGVAAWIVATSQLDLTRRLRARIRPFVSRHVASNTTFIFSVQAFHHPYLDAFFSFISYIVSVPFYTGFLPILVWSGHPKLGRQLTLLMAFCDYVGNSIKDLLSAPRPSSPPVRRVMTTKDEKENAMEYGLPSSHLLNTFCLSGYLLHYNLNSENGRDHSLVLAVGLALIVLLVGLIAVGRIYLGMHSAIDIVAGICFALPILAFWLTVHVHIDKYIVSGHNVISFWACLSFLLLFAYPKPELPTPSFEYHTAFNGVAFGMVCGIHRTFRSSGFHSDTAPRLFTPHLPFGWFAVRLAVGIPAILAAKSCGKAAAKRLLPVVCGTLSIPVRSSCYVPSLKESRDCIRKKPDGTKLPCFLCQMMLRQNPDQAFDIDTGIRFLQYAGLAWAATDIVPGIFSCFNL